MVRVSFHMTEGQHNELVMLSRASGKSVSHLVRRAVRLLLRKAVGELRRAVIAAATGDRSSKGDIQ